MGNDESMHGKQPKSLFKKKKLSIPATSPHQNVVKATRIVLWDSTTSFSYPVCQGKKKGLVSPERLPCLSHPVVGEWCWPAVPLPWGGM